MKTGKPANPPPWESFALGDHPAFKPIDKAEAEKMALAAIAEAQLFVGGPADKLATDQQRFLADAERKRIHHEANILITEGEIRERHVQALNAALIDLGRFEEADTDYAKEVQQACARDDSEDCGCQREKVTLVQGAREVQAELDRRTAKKFQFDPYCGEVVMLYECSHCGTLNAMAEPPARQAGRELVQKQIEADTRRAIATGTAPIVPAHDAHFLKA